MKFFHIIFVVIMMIVIIGTKSTFTSAAALVWAESEGTVDELELLKDAVEQYLEFIPEEASK